MVAAPHAWLLGAARDRRDGQLVGCLQTAQQKRYEHVFAAESRMADDLQLIKKLKILIIN